MKYWKRAAIWLMIATVIIVLEYSYMIPKYDELDPWNNSGGLPQDFWALVLWILTWGVFISALAMVFIVMIQSMLVYQYSDRMRCKRSHPTRRRSIDITPDYGAHLDLDPR